MNTTVTPPNPRSRAAIRAQSQTLRVRRISNGRECVGARAVCPDDRPSRLLAHIEGQEPSHEQARRASGEESRPPAQLGRQRHEDQRGAKANPIRPLKKA